MLVAFFEFRNGDRLEIDLQQPKQLEALARIGDDRFFVDLYGWKKGTAENYLKEQVNKALLQYCKRVERMDKLEDWMIKSRYTRYGTMQGLENWIINQKGGNR